MYSIILSNPLFKNCSEEHIENLLKSIDVKQKTYLKDTVASNTLSSKRQIMFMLTGNAKVEQIHTDGSSTFFKRLGPGDVFGILSIFNDEDNYPTHIVFEENSDVLCIEENQVLKLIRLDDSMMRNYLTFFNGQVQYLLNRIALFSQTSAEDRVIRYLEQVKSDSGLKRDIKTKVELSEYLGISRATLYRIIEKLEKQGVLGKENSMDLPEFLVDH